MYRDRLALLIYTDMQCMELFGSDGPIALHPTLETSIAFQIYAGQVLIIVKKGHITDFWTIVC